ncbi:MAG: hypothetical protein B7Z20_12205 [Sphingobium sp. 32-64-5]|nr:MAG: hypothetical protein B7Z20_12205 [Sphingobium sp. 32-64-5]
MQIVRDHGGRLAIAHVLERDVAEASPETAERLRAELPDAARDAALIVRAGSAPEILAQVAAERGSDLIVTGVARYNSIGDYLLGTVVDHIVRRAQAPVLVVRRRPAHPYRRIVVATDLSDCSRAALLSAARLFPGADFTLVHAFHVPYEAWLKSDDVKEYVRAEAEKGMATFLSHEEIAPLRSAIEPVVVEGETGSIVLDRLERTKADLLVLGTHGRSGFAHATIGSQAEALLFVAGTDVLMVRERK